MKTVSDLCREALELVKDASTSGHINYFEPCEGFAEKIKDAFCRGVDLSIQHDPTIPYRWTTDSEERIVAIFGNGPTSESNQKLHAFAANHIKQIAERCLELERELQQKNENGCCIVEHDYRMSLQKDNQKLREALEGLTNAALAGIKPLQSQVDAAFELLKGKQDG